MTQPIETSPELIERAYLVGVRWKQNRPAALKKAAANTGGGGVGSGSFHSASMPGANAETPSLPELERLAQSAGAEVVASEEVPLSRCDAATFVGSGHANEIAGQTAMLGANIVIFDDALSPAQQRNLEEKLSSKVIDRPQLILDIFARRAQTAEGKLQVELAQLKYLLPRLRGMWKHLERQNGGIGTRGPGERQIETDRRRIRERINRLERLIERVKSTRRTQRRRRSRAHLPSVALVGYTNAGKSTLLNSLTDSTVTTRDQLFATLDPTTRVCELPRGTAVALSDTVGFVSKLPPQLVAAFRATLEEVCFADLLLFVVDCTSEDVDRDIATTREVIEDLGAAGKDAIIVWNKADAHPDPVALRSLAAEYPGSVVVSARSGEGLHELRETIERQLDTRSHHVTLRLGHDQYQVLARLHDEADVTSVEYDEEGMKVEADVPGWMAKECAKYRVGGDGEAA